MTSQDCQMHGGETRLLRTDSFNLRPKSGGLCRFLWETLPHIGNLKRPSWLSASSAITALHGNERQSRNNTPSSKMGAGERFASNNGPFLSCVLFTFSKAILRTFRSYCWTVLLKFAGSMIFSRLLSPRAKSSRLTTGHPKTHSESV